MTTLDNATAMENTVTMVTGGLLTSALTEMMTEGGGGEPDVTEWVMSRSCYVITLTLLSLEASLALLSNSLLIVTIRYSPSLKTPPNSQLISICVNNLLLVLNMILGLVSLYISSSTRPSVLYTLDVLGNLQLFLTSTSCLQYWCIFSAIGFYRCTTLHRPSMSTRTRKTIVCRSIWIGWFLSTFSGMMLALAFRSSKTIINWNPFRQRIVYDKIPPLTLYQSLALLLLLGVFLGGLIMLVSSYYRIFRMLYVNRPFCQNRVYPLVRNASISSEDNDLTLAVRPSYRPTIAFPSPTPFTISGNTFGDNSLTVHFNKSGNSVSMDFTALENPIRAHRFSTVPQPLPHQQLQQQTSNASRNSIPNAEFTDISPVGEMQRSQRFKTTCALRNQSMKRERLSLGGATKNSLVMLLTYFLFSFPMVLVSIPGLLPTTTAFSIALPILCCRLIFFINSPAYPIWYLIFSRRVRKCLHRLIKHAKARLNMC